MDLDPKGANNQLKEAIEPAISRGAADDDKTGQTTGHETVRAVRDTYGMRRVGGGSVWGWQDGGWVRRLVRGCQDVFV